MNVAPSPVLATESPVERFAGRLMLRAIDTSGHLSFDARRRRLGALMRYICAPLLGWPGGISETLKLVQPDLARAKRREIAKRAARHAGEGFAELLCTDSFRRRLDKTLFVGPGVDAMRKAALDGRGIVLVTSQLGHPDAVVAALAVNGLPVATQDTPSPGGVLDQRITEARKTLGGKRFPPGPDGERALENHIGAGGFGVLMVDGADHKGAAVRLFGARVRTPLLPASIALRQHAVFIPAFAIRRPNGRYALMLSDEIDHAHPEDMMQSYQAAVEIAAATHLEQFHWAEPRWQPERYLS